MYQLIITDLDGTLLRSDKTISSKTIALLKKLTDKGVIFVPATGRCANELPNILTELPFLRYVSFCNGVGIADLKENKSYGDLTIDTKTILKVLAFSKNWSMLPSVVINNKRYTFKGKSDIFNKYSPTSVKNNITMVDDLFKMIENGNLKAQKLLFYLGDLSAKRTAINQLKQAFPNLAVSSSGDYNIELNNKEANKGASLKHLCELLNIPIEDTIGFGDNENDIELLKVAGLSVVTENGSPLAKEYADEITLSCDEDGVRVSLEKHFKDLLA